MASCSTYTLRNQYDDAIDLATVRACVWCGGYACGCISMFIRIAQALKYSPKFAHTQPSGHVALNLFPHTHKPFPRTQPIPSHTTYSLTRNHSLTHKPFPHTQPIPSHITHSLTHNSFPHTQPIPSHTTHSFTHNPFLHTQHPGHVAVRQVQSARQPRPLLLRSPEQVCA